jgi:chemotaxis protein CheD
MVSGKPVRPTAVRPQDDKPPAAEVFIHQGEAYWSEKERVVATVVGSCLALVLHSPEDGFGAICHAFLPTVTPNAPAVPNESAFTYVDQGLVKLAELFTRRGIPPGRVRVKIFGGAELLRPGGGQGAATGPQNIAQAKKTLRQLGLTLELARWGGHSGRKVIFAPRSGTVWMRRAGAIVRFRD